MANTRETIGETACLDALVADTLTTFEDDGVTKVGMYALYYRTSLSSLTLPYCAGVGAYGVSGCDSLSVVDILGGGSVATYAFYNDASFRHLILRGSSMTTLDATSAFTSTPFIYGEGVVYVSADMVDRYRSATNWSRFTVKPISDYPASDLSTISDSWDDIIAACGNGTYTKYQVGGTKSIDIDGTTYYMQLVAKDADVLASDGTTTVPTTWVMYRKLYGTAHRMNPANNARAQGTGANGGWEFSEMRSWLNDTVLPLFPANVRSAIKEVRKYSDIVVPGESSITHDSQTSDRLWIPSHREIYGGSGYETQGPTYTSVMPNNSSRIKYDQRASVSNWHLRTAASVGSFMAVSTGGSSGSITTPGSIGVVLGFCI